jgi:hypothetical protein
MAICSPALLWINMAENWACLTIIGGSLPYYISTKSVEQFIGFMKSPFMVMCKVGFIMDQ